MDDTGSSAVLIVACLGFLIVVGAVVAIYVFALTRKATDAVKTKPRNIRSFSTPIPYGDAINRLLGFAPTQSYKVEDVAPDGSRVILGTSITFFSYGFFYPIYFSVEPGGSTIVEVGIVSRAFQWGPVVSFNHDKVFNMVRQAVLPYVPTAQPPSPYSSQPPQPPQYTAYPPNQPPPPPPANPPYPSQSPTGGGSPTSG